MDTVSMTENLYTPDCIRTYTGKYVNVFEPTTDMICIEDIAHSLAQQPRFAGHLREHYSVGQHSVLSSHRVPEEHRLAALLHDASEAYMVDIPRPIKYKLSSYKEIEDNLMHLIAEKFGFEYPLPDSVKKVDEFMLQWEWESLMLANIHPMNRIVPWSISYTEAAFIELFHKINFK